MCMHTRKNGLQTSGKTMKHDHIICPTQMFIFTFIIVTNESGNLQHEHIHTGQVTHLRTETNHVCNRDPAWCPIKYNTAELKMVDRQLLVRGTNTS